MARHAQMNPGNQQPQFLHPHGPGMYGPERSEHPDPGFAARNLWMEGLTNEEWDEYMNGQSVQRNIERSYIGHDSDKQRHAGRLPLRAKRTNARYLTKASQPFQDDEDEWVQHYKTTYGMNDQDAANHAWASMRPLGGAPRSYMTPGILMRRQTGDQAKVTKRKPAAKKPKKPAKKVVRKVVLKKFV